MRRSVWMLCALTFACAPQSPTKQAASATSSGAPSVDDTSEPFAIVAIDDRTDPFEKISDDKIPFGSGIGIFQELVPLGERKAGVTHFARIVYRAGEPWRATRSRFLAWSNPIIAMAPGERFGFEEVVDYDPATKTATPVGLRTYLLTGDVVVGHHDVIEAHVLEGDEDVPELAIAMTLNDIGRARLDVATHLWIDRRFAIVSHDKIQAAPVVRQAIRNGKIQIAMGPRSDASVARANALVEEILYK